MTIELLGIDSSRSSLAVSLMAASDKAAAAATAALGAAAVAGAAVTPGWATPQAAAAQTPLAGEALAAALHAGSRSSTGSSHHHLLLRHQQVLMVQVSRGGSREGSERLLAQGAVQGDVWMEVHEASFGSCCRWQFQAAVRCQECSSAFAVWEGQARGYR